MSKLSICTPKEDTLDIKLVNCTHVCRYHKYPKRTSYKNSLLVPKGMCIDLFHSAYPYSLSLIYGSKHKGPIIVSCPNPDSNTAISVKKVPSKARLIRNTIRLLFSIFGRKLDLPSHDIVLEIQEDTNSTCLYKYNKGQSFTFNIWQGKELCPATFDAVYPVIHNITRGKTAPWCSKDNPPCNVVCPDPKSNITMKVKRF